MLKFTSVVFRDKWMTKYMYNFSRLKQTLRVKAYTLATVLTLNSPYYKLQAGMS